MVSISQVTERIRAIRCAIRLHRDQIGDYRCWVDDEVLYHQCLPELTSMEPELPSVKEFHANCQAFFKKRQNPSDQGKAIPLDSSIGPLELSYRESLDIDLSGREPQDLDRVWEELLQAIRVHRLKGVLERTYTDDAELYSVLPEKSPALTALPPEELFLGRNCPAYNEHCHRYPEEFRKAVWKAER
ncbi:MAG: hypothetical protein KDD64_10490 [Bdellovibrionales bacterium]|nr:hypothetical protein [Bdellovibrionales bacterium]